MIIHSFKIYGFGDIISKEYVLQTGITEIKCLNQKEAVTIRDFIISCLFGFGGRTEGGFRKLYFPGTMLKFGGEIHVEYTGRQYLITRQWGLTCSDDTTRVFELPENKQIRINNSKSIGEQLFGISKSTFMSCLMVDFNDDNDFVGYLTGSMGFTDLVDNSFAAADKKFSERLLQIKSVKDKDGELDKLVIKKMSMNNEMTRLSETDQKINSKKKKMEALKWERDEIKKRTQSLFQKIRVAKACEDSLQKDKAISVLSVIESDSQRIDQLTEQSKEIEKRAFIKENIGLMITAGVGAVVGILGCFINFIISIVGLVLLLVGIIPVLVAIPKFSKRFFVADGETTINIYELINRFKVDLEEQISKFTEILQGKSYEEAEIIWREADDILKNASEEERRNAALKRTAEDLQEYNGILSKLKPIEDEIEKIENEIDALSLSLSESYSEATSVLFGIDEKIKSLYDEYKITSLAYEGYKETLSDIKNSFLPKVVSSARKIYRDTYGAERIDISFDENFGVTVKASPENKQKAKFAFDVAISKTVLTSEFGFNLISFDKIPDSIKNHELPAEVKQLLVLES